MDAMEQMKKLDEERTNLDSASKELEQNLRVSVHCFSVTSCHVVCDVMSRGVRSCNVILHTPDPR